jgi:hypothetical protein
MLVMLFYLFVFIKQIEFLSKIDPQGAFCTFTGVVCFFAGFRLYTNRKHKFWVNISATKALPAHKGLEKAKFSLAVLD